MDPSSKSTRLVQIFFCAFLAIALRVWHLQVIERESKLEEAQRPQKRTVIEKGDRGLIYDRFRIPLAINRICYNACIYYDQIAQIQASATKEIDGKKERLFPRKEYISTLAAALAPLLHMEKSRIEDLIHSKASLFPHSPSF